MIKFGNDILGDWVISEVMCYRQFKDNSGSASIICHDKNGEFIKTELPLTWHVKLVGSLYDYYPAFYKSNFPVFLKEQSDEVRIWVDKFLIRMSNLASLA